MCGDLSDQLDIRSKIFEDYGDNTTDHHPDQQVGQFRKEFFGCDGG